MEFTAWTILAYLCTFFIFALVVYDKWTERKAGTSLDEFSNRLDIFQRDYDNTNEDNSRRINWLESTLKEYTGYLDNVDNRLINIEKKFSSVEKTAEESKKLINQISIAQAFVPRHKRVDETKKTN